MYYNIGQKYYIVIEERWRPNYLNMTKARIILGAGLKGGRKSPTLNK